MRLQNGQDMVLVWRVADDRVRYTWMREVWTGKQPLYLLRLLSIFPTHRCAR
jgi:hypothetical protein